MGSSHVQFKQNKTKRGSEQLNMDVPGPRKRSVSNTKHANDVNVDIVSLRKSPTSEYLSHGAQPPWVIPAPAIVLARVRV